MTVKLGPCPISKGSYSNKTESFTLPSKSPVPVKISASGSATLYDDSGAVVGYRGICTGDMQCVTIIFRVFFKAFLICTAARTAASNTKLKYRTLVTVRLLSVVADNEHVHFSHTPCTRGTS